LLLVPLIGFGNSQTEPNTSAVFNQECNDAANSVNHDKNCLVIEKNKEANENYKNFQENNHSEQTIE
ncbi:MAG: hypothetical protein ACHP65_06485, partial [Legionellales bacterium]